MALIERLPQDLFTRSSSIPGKESEIDKTLKHITLEEVSEHDSREDCWIVIYDRVYDVTSFLDRVSYQLWVMDDNCIM